MVNFLMSQSETKAGGFYLYDEARLLKELSAYNGKAQKILIGVSFALLDMAEKHPDINLSDVTIMETGGMKGRRKEILREELHQILTTNFHVSHIHSEYGMTEMLSQAYSKGQGRFICSPTMKAMVRDPYNPMKVSETGKGALNIIDLSNIYSCSFLASADMGEVFEDGSFTVSGRVETSQLRGCNLLFDQ